MLTVANEKREEVKLYILKLIDKNDANFVSKTAGAYDITKTTVNNYVKQLEKDNIIKKTNASKNFRYELKKDCHYLKYDTNAYLNEDNIFYEDISEYVCNLPKNIFEIWRFGFTEMMNNAIDHAEAKKIRCKVTKDILNTRISVIDNGRGIFRTIKDSFEKLKGEDISLDDAIIQLAAGKPPTDRERHEGEGIFFTSKLFDKFVICSDDKYFAHNAVSNRIIDDEHGRFIIEKGTITLIELSNSSEKDLKSVFDTFKNGVKGFIKTQIPIASIFMDGYPVSRAEAKRLCLAIDRFEEIILDFSGVKSIGQEFAHELFVVFASNYPQIKLIPQNCNYEVGKMIKRVLAESRFCVKY